MNYKELKNWRQNLDQRLKSLKENGVSLSLIAKEAKVSRVVIYRWINGDVSPTIMNYIDLMDVVKKYEKKCKKNLTKRK